MKRLDHAKKPPRDGDPSTKAAGRASGIPEIPGGYNIDTLVLMPVDREVAFVYWEVTERTLGPGPPGQDVSSARLTIRITGRDSGAEVASVDAEERIGKGYVYCGASTEPLVAEIGWRLGGDFIPLFASKTALSFPPGRGGAERTRTGTAGERPAIAVASSATPTSSSHMAAAGREEGESRRLEGDGTHGGKAD